MPMPRSNPPTPASAGRTTVRESGDLLLVESPTAEEALERLSSLLGPDVEIVAAGKVTRGGIGGFFAREMVQLSARCPSRPPPAAPPPTTGPEAPLKAPDEPEAPLKAPDEEPEAPLKAPDEETGSRSAPGAVGGTAGWMGGMGSTCS